MASLAGKKFLWFILLLIADMLEKYATNKNKLADYGRNGNYGSKIGIIRLANLISIGENKLNFLLV